MNKSLDFDLLDGEEICEETLLELSNGKEDGEDE